MKVYVVNGFPCSGKTTFEEYVGKLVKHISILSTISPIEKMAYDFGWNGEKDAKGRKLLADLKRAWVTYDDQPFRYISYELQGIDYDWPDCVVFIDSREPEEIKKLCEEFEAKSVLIRRATVENREQSNESDANVLNYDYDIVIENNGDLSDLALAAENFIKKEELPKAEIPYYIDLFGNIVRPYEPKILRFKNGTQLDLTTPLKFKGLA